MTQLQYSDTTDKLGLVQLVDYLCDTTDSSYPIADKTRHINMALDELVTEQIIFDNSGHADDTNYTVLPVKTTNLVTGQQQYQLPADYLFIERIEVLSSDGKGVVLKPIDKSEIESSLIDYGTGTPKCYDLGGQNYFLYPTPDYNATDGIKVWYSRLPDLFTSADTTKVAGISRVLLPYLAYRASIIYCRKNLPERVSEYSFESDKYLRTAKRLMGGYNRRLNPSVASKSQSK